MRPPNAGKGRPKGSKNKQPALLKEALLEAATQAGGDDGLVGYLLTQARSNPQSFLPLLGKVLPMQISGDEENPLRTVTTIELVAGESKNRASA